MQRDRGSGIGDRRVKLTAEFRSKYVRSVTVGGGEETDFQGSRFRSIFLSLRSDVRPPFSSSGTARTRRFVRSFSRVYLSVNVPWMSRLSRFGVTLLLRFTFAMSLPVRSGRGKSVTQQRSEAIVGRDRMREARKTGPAILSRGFVRVAPRRREISIP